MLTILAILGLIFPFELINAIRSENNNKALKHKIFSSISFSMILVMILMIIDQRL